MDLERCVDDELQIGLRGDGETRVFERHAAGDRVLDALEAALGMQHVLPPPKLAKLGADARQGSDETFEIRVAGMAGDVRSEHGERPRGKLVPIEEKFAMRFIGENHVDDVRSSPSSSP
jgi:hypothetical protein